MEGAYGASTSRRHKPRKLNIDSHARVNRRRALTVRRRTCVATVTVKGVIDHAALIARCFVTRATTLAWRGLTIVVK
jgi:hypothetical protein